MDSLKEMLARQFHRIDWWTSMHHQKSIHHSHLLRWHRWSGSSFYHINYWEDFCGILFAHVPWTSWKIDKQVHSLFDDFVEWIVFVTNFIEVPDILTNSDGNFFTLKFDEQIILARFEISVSSKASWSEESLTKILSIFPSVHQAAELKVRGSSSEIFLQILSVLEWGRFGWQIP